MLKAKTRTARSTVVGLSGCLAVCRESEGRVYEVTASSTLVENGRRSKDHSGSYQEQEHSEGFNDESKLHVKVAALQEVAQERNAGLTDVTTPSLISLETSTPICWESNVKEDSSLPVSIENGKYLDQHREGVRDRKDSGIRPAPVHVEQKNNATQKTNIPKSSNREPVSQVHGLAVQVKDKASNRNKENFDQPNVKRLSSNDRSSSFKRSESSSSTNSKKSAQNKPTKHEAIGREGGASGILILCVETQATYRMKEQISAQKSWKEQEDDDEANLEVETLSFDVMLQRQFEERVQELLEFIDELKRLAKFLGLGNHGLVFQISGTARLERKCEPEGREHHHRARQPGSTFRTSSHSPTLSGEGSRTGMFRPDRPQSVDDLRKLLRLKVQDGSDLQTAAKTLRFDLSDISAEFSMSVFVQRLVSCEGVDDVKSPDVDCRGEENFLLRDARAPEALLKCHWVTRCNFASFILSTEFVLFYLNVNNTLTVHLPYSARRRSLCAHNKIIQMFRPCTELRITVHPVMRVVTPETPPRGVPRPLKYFMVTGAKLLIKLTYVPSSSELPSL
eukprot:768568-Hanusia_phi.AAC.5